MSKEIIDELKLIGNYFDVNKLDVYEQKHHIRFTSIIKDRINFYINKSDKKQLTIHGVSHSKNLNLIQTIENTKQLPQVQYDLQRQLRELRVMANKLGLYDAADFLTSYCG